MAGRHRRCREFRHHRRERRNPAGGDGKGRRPRHVQRARACLAARCRATAPHHRPAHRDARAVLLANGQRRRGDLRGREHREHGRDPARCGRGWLAGAAPAARPAGAARRQRGHGGRLARSGKHHMSLDTHGPGLWYATRATGLVTLLMLTVSVLLGLLVAGRFSSQRWPRFLTQGLHRNVSLLVLVFLVLHVGTTVVDTYTSIPLTAAFIPLASSYKTAWLSLGAVALDMLIALIATSLLRSRIGHRAWRRVHWLAYACWPVAVAHGLGTGTDRNASWVFALTVACAVSVLCVA